MLFKKALQEFEDYLKSREYSKRTVNGYRKELTYLNRWLEDKYNGPVYLDELDSTNLEKYLLYRREIKGDKSATRSRTGYIFRSFYDFIEKRGVGENIARTLEPVKVRQKERKYLEEREIKEVIKSIDKSLIKIVTEFLYYTGVRISECLKLNLDDVDFENEIIHIKKGKGNKDRKIALNSKLKDKLRYYIDNIRPENVDSNYLFATERSGSLSRTYYNKRLKVAVKKAGMDKDISAHNIRHSTAVALVKKDVDLPTIKKLLGHKNLKTTSVYLHSDMSQMRDALEVI